MNLSTVCAVLLIFGVVGKIGNCFYYILLIVNVRVHLFVFHVLLSYSTNVCFTDWSLNYHTLSKETSNNKLTLTISHFWMNISRFHRLRMYTLVEIVENYIRGSLKRTARLLDQSEDRGSEVQVSFGLDNITPSRIQLSSSVD